jgi:hypothetical protein
MGAIKNITKKVIIPINAALSNGFNLGEKVLSGIQMPVAWDAASITFQTSHDGGTTWVDLHDAAGGEITVTTPAAGEYRALDPAWFNSCSFFKVRSGTSALPVNQTAARSIGVVSRKFFARS